MFLDWISIGAVFLTVLAPGIVLNSMYRNHLKKNLPFNFHLTDVMGAMVGAALLLYPTTLILQKGNPDTALVPIVMCLSLYGMVLGLIFNVMYQHAYNDSPGGFARAAYATGFGLLGAFCLPMLLPLFAYLLVVAVYYLA